MCELNSPFHSVVHPSLDPMPSISSIIQGSRVSSSPIMPFTKPRVPSADIKASTWQRCTSCFAVETAIQKRTGRRYAICFAISTPHQNVS